jgi:hypothetical protein
MVVYDDVETTADNPFVFTDEPLFAHPDEIKVQAARTHARYITKLAQEQ